MSYVSWGRNGSTMTRLLLLALTFVALWYLRYDWRLRANRAMDVL